VLIQENEWGIGSMLGVKNTVYLINGDTDKICKYRLNNDYSFSLVYQTKENFSWPLLNCFVVFKDAFGTEFIIGIHNGDNFKNILVEMVLPKKTTSQFKILKGLHEKTICNVVYNKKRNIFASGGRDMRIHLWSLNTDSVYPRQGKEIKFIILVVFLKLLNG
jgi:WD40 repeat protein